MLRFPIFLLALVTLSFVACGRLPLESGDASTNAMQGHAGTRGGAAGTAVPTTGSAGTRGAGGRGGTGGTSFSTAGTTGIAGNWGVAGTTGAAGTYWGAAGTYGGAGTWGYAGTWGGAGTGGQCFPGSSVCVEQGYVNTCRFDGFWGMPAYCEHGCTDGRCRQCDFGATQCVSPMLVQWCNFDGTWGPPNPCPNGACFNNACQGLCQPGAAECLTGFSRHVCGNNGIWGPELKCERGCAFDGACTECNPFFERTCLTSGSGRACQPDGKWGPIFKCNASTCTDGRCSDCSPGFQSCVDDKNVHACSDDGVWQASSTCDNYCLNDSCRSCKPGETQCPSGDSIQICNSDGEWGDWITCANTCAAGACTSNPKKVFVTSTTYKGGELGGLLGADAKCQQRAAAASLPGTYKAWLSDFNSSPANRFTQTGGPYLLVNGSIVANNWTGLTSGTLRHSINVTELGTAASTASTAFCGVPIVWTNTNSDGNLTAFDYTCGDWTDSGGYQSSWGTTAQQSGWSQACSGGNSPTSGCSAIAPLFCFQQ